MRSKETSTSSILFWNLLGNLSAAAVSVLYLMIVSRYTSSFAADQFSIAYSFGNLWIIIGMFQIRNFQGTDVGHRFEFWDYFLARVITTALMLITCIPYLYFSGFSIEDQFSLSIVLLLIAYRFFDAWSDLFQGQFQKFERLDIAGKLMLGRYTLSFLTFSAVLILSQSLLRALVILVLLNLVFCTFIEFPLTNKMEHLQFPKKGQALKIKDSFQILKECFPLFLSGFLINIIFNEPKFAIDTALRQGLLYSGVQRDYNILFMPAFVMSLCILIIRPLITKMAKSWAYKQYKEFTDTLVKIFIGIFIMSILSILLAYFIGIPVLNLIFGVDLNNNLPSLIILIISGILYSCSLVIENILTIFRKQSYLVWLIVLLIIFSKIVTFPLVEKMGLLGGALSFFYTMLLYTLGSIAIYIVVKIRLSSKTREN